MATPTTVTQEEEVSGVSSVRKARESEEVSVSSVSSVRKARESEEVSAISVSSIKKARECEEVSPTSVSSVRKARECEEVSPASVSSVSKVKESEEVSSISVSSIKKAKDCEEVSPISVSSISKARECEEVSPMNPSSIRKARECEEVSAISVSSIKKARESEEVSVSSVRKARECEEVSPISVSSVRKAKECEEVSPTSVSSISKARECEEVSPISVSSVRKVKESEEVNPISVSSVRKVKDCEEVSPASVSSVRKVKESEEVSVSSVSSVKARECGQCGGRARYTCPACGARTCSLVCVRQHKRTSECTGVRDKTRLVFKENMNNLTLLSDYRFLEHIDNRLEDNLRSRLLRSAKRTQDDRFSLPSHLQHLKHQAALRGTTLKFMPAFFTNHRHNTTRYHFKEEIIRWHIKWVFHQADVVFVDCSVDENTSLSKLLAKYMNPKNKLSAEENDKLAYYHSASYSRVSVLIKTDTPDSGSVFQELEILKSLRVNFARKVITEYPVLYVVLRDHMDSYLDYRTDETGHDDLFDEFEAKEQVKDADGLAFFDAENSVEVE